MIYVLVFYTLTSDGEGLVRLVMREPLYYSQCVEMREAIQPLLIFGYAACETDI